MLQSHKVMIVSSTDYYIEVSVRLHFHLCSSLLVLQLYGGNSPQTPANAIYLSISEHKEQQESMNK